MGHSRILSLSTLEEEKLSPILDISPRDKSNTEKLTPLGEVIRATMDTSHLAMLRPFSIP